MIFLPDLVVSRNTSARHSYPGAAEHYYISVVTSEANGDDGYFMIKKGQVIFKKSESELRES